MQSLAKYERLILLLTVCPLNCLSVALKLRFSYSTEILLQWKHRCDCACLLLQKHWMKCFFLYSLDARNLTPQPDARLAVWLAQSLRWKLIRTYKINQLSVRNDNNSYDHWLLIISEKWFVWFFFSHLTLLQVVLVNRPWLVSDFEYSNVQLIAKSSWTCTSLKINAHC